ncbi:hypothetical protein [Novosphingopyxis sp.]|uniref:hypothetical protein n=1 Tax=Novosphingopyxis sp. TaxID=2709690 RepID=UPI003B5987E9
MKREYVKAVRAVSEILWQAERSADIAMADTARLLATILEARTEVGFAAAVGDDVISNLTSTLQGYGHNRRQLISSHARLAEFRDHLGFNDSSFGGGGDKEVPTPKTAVVQFPVERAA